MGPIGVTSSDALSDKSEIKLFISSIFFSGLEISDSALYTCQARSISGQAMLSAFLRVARPDEAVEFDSVPFLSEFPGSPSEPYLVNATSHSLVIAWEKPIRIGASAIQSYLVPTKLNSLYVLSQRYFLRGLGRVLHLEYAFTLGGYFWCAEFGSFHFRRLPAWNHGPCLGSSSKSSRAFSTESSVQTVPNASTNRRRRCFRSPISTIQVIGHQSDGTRRGHCSRIQEGETGLGGEWSFLLEAPLWERRKCQ